jgi:hypothetical protein
MMRGPITGSQSPTALWGIDIYDSGASNIAASIGAYDDDLGPAIAATDAGGNFVFLGDGSARGTWDTYSVNINYLTSQVHRLRSTVFSSAQRRACISARTTGSTTSISLR